MLSIANFFLDTTYYLPVILAEKRKFRRVFNSGYNFLQGVETNMATVASTALHVPQ